MPHIRRRIFIAAAGISLFVSLGLLNVRNSTRSVLETNINGEYRQIQLASLSKQVIKLTRRDLIIFFLFWRYVIDVKVICHLRFGFLVLSLTTQEANHAAVTLFKTDNIITTKKMSSHAGSASKMYILFRVRVRSRDTDSSLL